MSIVPFLSSLALDFDGDHHDWDHYLDDDFGFGIHPLELVRPRNLHNFAMTMHPRRRYNPYDRHHAMLRRSNSNRLAKTEEWAKRIMPTVTKDGFQVCMDVSSFRPNELTVKTVDKTVVVEGKHEEREDDHGMIQRHFVRKYTLPKDYDPNDVVSTISSDGVLTIKAPPPPAKGSKQIERVVQIQHTGPAHLSVKPPEGDATAKGKNHNGAAEKMETTK